MTLDIKTIQLEYLDKIIKFVKSNDVDLFVTIHPLPVDVLANISNYRETSNTLKNIVESNGFEFIDYNEIIKLDPIYDFMDSDHLNGHGVNKFNGVLLDNLTSSSRYSKFFKGSISK